jgi:NTP pyrophosphatase (non-canonical NTP hydrolase)
MEQMYIIDIAIRNRFVFFFNRIAELCHENAVNKGFWETDRGDAEAIALMHSELSEALESIRSGSGPDDKIPEFSGVEAEFADCIIRIMDTAQMRGYRVAEALVAKMEYNQSRPYKHGKKF